MKKGEKVKVRLSTGEVVNANYEHSAKYAERAHWVTFEGRSYLAQKFSPKLNPDWCRFVGNAGVID